MIRGLYTACTGMRNEQKRLDIMSNNMANSATVGYKEESVSNQSFDNMLTIKLKDESEYLNRKKIGAMSLGVKIGEVYTNYDQGSLRQTENDFDFAIEGDGFFQVEREDGNIKYTRAGSFTKTEDGRIVDFDGNELQGLNGTITLPINSNDINVDIQGNILADGVYVDKIQLIDFQDYNYIEKYGDSLYQTVDGAETKTAEGLIRQGYTEQSNVNVISEMVDLITITRAYETNQKVIKTVDSMTDRTVNDIARV